MRPMNTDPCRNGEGRPGPARQRPIAGALAGVNNLDDLGRICLASNYCAVSAISAGSARVEGLLQDGAAVPAPCPLRLISKFRNQAGGAACDAGFLSANRGRDLVHRDRPVRSFGNRCPIGTADLDNKITTMGKANVSIQAGTSGPQ